MVDTETFSQSLTKSVCEKIEALIIDGSLAPGDRIRENLMATRLGVSRGPVREACRLLEAVGLVTIVPRQGAFVRSLTVGEIVNLFEIRASLGRLAGSQAAVAITRDQMLTLEGLIDEMDECVRTNDSARFTELNMKFHAKLYEATDNPRLAELDRTMGNELRIYRHKGAAFGGLAVSNQEHRALVESLATGNSEEAGARLEKHILNGRDRFIRAMTTRGSLVLNWSAEKRPATKS